MAHHHHHHADRKRAEPGKGRRLLIALALNVGVAAAEAVGGAVSGSLALLADAAHNLSDAASVLVSYMAFRIAQHPPDRRRSFGFGRVETVGALINLTTLLAVGVYLLFEAGSRFFGDQGGELAGKTMLIVGAIALAEDLLAAWVLRKDLGSLNVKSTYLHMIADALATVGVLVAGGAVLVWGQAAAWLDPAATALIAFYIFWHGGREIRETISVLIDAAPRGFDHEGLHRTLANAPGVVQVRHVHLWRREEDRLALEAHLVLADGDLAGATRMKEHLKAELRDKFEIKHATLEFELAKHKRNPPGADRQP